MKKLERFARPAARGRRRPAAGDRDGLQGLDGLLRALGDPTRLRILGLLCAAGEMCVCDIHATLRIPQSKASRHLAYLRRSGLVLPRRRGVWIHYRLSEPADQVARALASSVCASLDHLPAVARDRQVLERRLGCCVRPRDAEAPVTAEPLVPEPQPLDSGT